MKNKMMYTLLFVIISLDAAQRRKRSCAGLPDLPEVHDFEDLEAYTQALKASGIEVGSAGQASPVDGDRLQEFGLETIDVTDRGFSVSRQLPTESSRPRSGWSFVTQAQIERDNAIGYGSSNQQQLFVGQVEKKIDAGRAADFPRFARATKKGEVCISITETGKRSLSEPIIKQDNTINKDVVRDLCSRGFEHGVKEVLIYYYAEMRSFTPEQTVEGFIYGCKRGLLK